MPGIALAHLRRQGDQRGAVVERPALRQVLCLQGEEITLQQGDAGDPVAAETIQLIDLGAQVVLLEEVAHGLFRKLHPSTSSPWAASQARSRVLPHNGTRICSPACSRSRDRWRIR